MCSKKIVATSQAPRVIGPYLQAVISGDLLFTSGQLPIDTATGRMVDGGIAEQAHQVFKNIEAIAIAVGAILQHTIKTNVFYPLLTISKRSMKSMRPISLPLFLQEALFSLQRCH